MPHAQLSSRVHPLSLLTLLKVGSAAPPLPAAPPATQVNSRLWRVPQRPQNYHKGFSGQMPSPVFGMSWPQPSGQAYTQSSCPAEPPALGHPEAADHNGT